MFRSAQGKDNEATGRPFGPMVQKPTDCDIRRLIVGFFSCIECFWVRALRRLGLFYVRKNRKIVQVCDRNFPGKQSVKRAEQGSEAPLSQPPLQGPTEGVKVDYRNPLSSIAAIHLRGLRQSTFSACRDRLKQYASIVLIFCPSEK